MRCAIVRVGAHRPHFHHHLGRIAERQDALVGVAEHGVCAQRACGRAVGQRLAAVDAYVEPGQRDVARKCDAVLVLEEAQRPGLGHIVVEAGVPTGLQRELKRGRKRRHDERRLVLVVDDNVERGLRAEDREAADTVPDGLERLRGGTVLVHVERAVPGKGGGGRGGRGGGRGSAGSGGRGGGAWECGRGGEGKVGRTQTSEKRARQ